MPPQRRGGHDGFLPAGVVFTGGGCRLLGFTEAAQSVLDLPVRIGAQAQFSGMTDQVTGPAYATAIGLLRWGTKLRHQQNGHVPAGAGVSESGSCSAEPPATRCCHERITAASVGLVSSETAT